MSCEKILNDFQELPSEQLACLPDFLIISPPKTGTTWLADNLRRHPRVFVSATKELKYFSNRHQRETLDWYLSQFRDGIGRVKGEASPSYCLLPRSTIQKIHEMIPHLKLIFMMREPVARAWSHAKHSFVCKEPPFENCTAEIHEVSDSLWMKCFQDDWNRLSGDYLGQLQRWSHFFPKEQILIGFYESLAQAPVRLFADVVRFLGIGSELDCLDGLATERINGGLRHPLSQDLERALLELHCGRTGELQRFLDERWQVSLPSRWERLSNASATVALDPSAQQCSTTIESAPVCRSDSSWDVSDEELVNLLNRDEMPPVATELIEPDFLGFNLVRHRHLYAAFHMSLGSLDPDQLSPQWWGEQTLAGTAATAADPTALKAHILKLQVARWQSQDGSRDGVVRRVDSLHREQEQRFAAQEQRLAAEERRLAANENASNQLVLRVDSLQRQLEQRVASLELLLPALTSIEQRVAVLESKWWHRAASWAEARLRSILSRTPLWRPLKALRRQLGRSLS